MPAIPCEDLNRKLLGRTQTLATAHVKIKGLLTTRRDLDDDIVRMLELWHGDILDFDFECTLVVDCFHGLCLRHGGRW